MEAAELISALIARVRQAGMAPPLRTRLAKLAYLTELEYYRRTQQRLTDLEWIFHRYGPFAHALSDLIGGPDDPAAGTAPPTASTKPVALDHNLESLLRSVVEEWGDADLNRLLDHVYFETEPMEGARRGQRLDFSCVLPRQPKTEPLKLDRSRLQALRARAARSAAAYSSRPRPALITPELAVGMELWDDEGRIRLAPGPCELDPDDLV